MNNEDVLRRLQSENIAIAKLLRRNHIDILNGGNSVTLLIKGENKGTEEIRYKINLEEFVGDMLKYSVEEGDE